MLDLRSPKLLIFDKNFPKQVFYTTLFVSAIILLASLKYQSFKMTLSLSIGIIISICSALVLNKWINYIFSDLRPDSNSLEKSNNIVKSVGFALMGIGKIFILGLVFFLVFKFLSINIYALFIGISVVQFVVVLNILSMLLVNALNGYKSPKFADTKGPNQRDAVGSNSVDGAPYTSN